MPCLIMLMIKMVLPPMLLRILSWEFKRCFTFQNTDSKYILVSHRNTRPIIFVKIARCIKCACKHGKSFWKPSHIYRKQIVECRFLFRYKTCLSPCMKYLNYELNRARGQHTLYAYNATTPSPSYCIKYKIYF